METNELFTLMVVFACIPLAGIAHLTLGWMINASIRWYRLRLVTGWSYGLLFGMALWVLAPWLTLSAAQFFSRQLRLPPEPVLYLGGLAGLWGIGLLAFFLALSQIFQLLVRRREISESLTGEHRP